MRRLGAVVVLLVVAALVAYALLHPETAPEVAATGIPVPGTSSPAQSPRAAPGTSPGVAVQPLAGGPRKVDVEVPEVPAAQLSARATQLEAQLARGEARASYELAVLLESCVLAREAISVMADMRPQGGAVDLAALGRLEARAKECQAIPPEKIARQSDYRDRAAAAGDIRAQLTFVDHPPPELRGDDGAFKNPEKVIEFKSRALGYLTAAAEAGAVQAMQKLAGAYAEGTLSPPDRAQALGYYLAAVTAAPEIDPGQASRGFYENGLSAEERARAAQLQQRLLRR